MIQSFFHKLLLRRHFWRYATFGEVAELYASRMLRMAALYMAGAFMAIYLFQIGYSIAQIALFWAGFYLFKVVAALPSAAVVGKIGPKHAIMVSNLLYIPAMIGFVLLPEFGPWMLLPVLVLEGLSAGMYSIAYTIDFSKVKSMEHAGKEIAYMNMIEKLTVAISPVIGGALAFFFGPQVVIALAAVLFALAAVPLFKTGEPVKTGEKLQFKGFPWRLLTRHWLAQISVGFDVFASGTVWTLFVAVFIIGIATDNQVYAVMGLLLSVVFIAALFASYVYGKIIDRRQGKQLMRLASIANFATHLVRPFIAAQ
ncbi:MFS transporter [Candidatus Saccharibacteria bacterium]|nr:MFS transporter [Candidatus Saccharibacteria bacterium]